MAVQVALEKAILAVAPDAEIKIGLVDGHWSGMVIAPQFESMTHLERQRSVWNRIRSDLGAQSREVGILLLYSPQEADSVETAQ